MSRSCAEPPVVVDRASAVPLTQQITGQLREVVRRGQVGAGERLPSSRTLAATLAVSRTVVTNAYAQLYAEGWLDGRHGSGSYAAVGAGTAHGAAAAWAAPASGAPQPARAPAGATAPSPVPGIIDLSPGIAWSAGISAAAWRRAWRRAGTVPPSAGPSSRPPAAPHTPSPGTGGDPRGAGALRQALAGYLRRMRAVSFGDREIVITRGVANSLDMLFAALLRPGDRVGIEEPGYPVGRDIAAARGLEPVPCPVDEHGLVVDRLPEGLRLVYTTPAHQYPLGGRLPVPRRRALLAWASRTGAAVVEDDYDSEFRYDVGPLPALYSMAPEVIVYLGTASKTLTTVFGAGWLVASPDLVRRLAETRGSLADRVPEAVQHALLAMLTSGDLERHIRRMRLEYARRRAALVAALTRPVGQRTFRLLGDTAGMHVVLELSGCPVDRLVAAAAECGIELFTLDSYFDGPPAMNGLILGYGTASLPRVRQAARVLRGLLAHVCG